MEKQILLQGYYKELYGNTEESKQLFKELLTIIKTAKSSRNSELKQLDQQGNKWYQSEKMVGMMLYLDNFSDDLTGFMERMDYLEELGITYVHFMPLLKTRKEQNDGGYAVVDYLNVDERFGNIEQLEQVILKLKERGIRTCIDFVLNHTAKEHEWAIESGKGNPEYKDMYMMYDNYDIPAKYEETMPEVFPGVAPGNFTYYDSIKKWVMTCFYEFQWDLNYKNPKVFNEISKTLLALGNIGIDIFRLDAIPFMWKELGTTCRNLAPIHTLLKMINLIMEEVCPCSILKGEAIVEPEEIVKYFGQADAKECHIMYNASLMVLLWNSLATRDVRLMTKSLIKDYGTPDDSVWINYARCHDDIGWGLENDILKELGFDPFLHKQFLIHFYEGTFEGSFSKGELYEFNPVDLDARNSGTMASMCGLEKALQEKNQYQIELALKRIELLNAVILSYTGIPILYSGDELGFINDWNYKEDKDKQKDSRWLHRGKFQWEKADNRSDLGSIEGHLFHRIKRMIHIRKSSTLFSSTLPSLCFDTHNKGVLAFAKEDKMIVMANFTEKEQVVPWTVIQTWNNEKWVDMIQGRTISMGEDIELGPYEFLWLQ